MALVLSMLLEMDTQFLTRWKAFKGPHRKTPLQHILWNLYDWTWAANRTMSLYQIVGRSDITGPADVTRMGRLFARIHQTERHNFSSHLRALRKRGLVCRPPPSANPKPYTISSDGVKQVDSIRPEYFMLLNNCTRYLEDRDYRIMTELLYSVRPVVEETAEYPKVWEMAKRNPGIGRGLSDSFDAYAGLKPGEALWKALRDIQFRLYMGRGFLGWPEIVILSLLISGAEASRDEAPRRELSREEARMLVTCIGLVLEGAENVRRNELRAIVARYPKYSLEVTERALVAG